VLAKDYKKPKLAQKERELGPSTPRKRDSSYLGSDSEVSPVPRKVSPDRLISANLVLTLPSVAGLLLVFP
jgi:hypothetical protein